MQYTSIERNAHLWKLFLSETKIWLYESGGFRCSSALCLFVCMFVCMFVFLCLFLFPLSLFLSLPHDLPSPFDSILEAVLTVSPNRQYLGIVCPTTPATHDPGKQNWSRKIKSLCVLMYDCMVYTWCFSKIHISRVSGHWKYIFELCHNPKVYDNWQSFLMNVGPNWDLKSEINIVSPSCMVPNGLNCVLNLLSSWWIVHFWYTLIFFVSLPWTPYT